MSPVEPSGHRVPWLRLWVDGEEAAGDVVASLRVEERVDRASTLTLVMASSPMETPAAGDGSADGGDWDTLLRGTQARDVGMPGLALLSRISVGFALRSEGRDGPSDDQLVFDGYVTGLEHRYAESRASDSELEVDAMDASYLMHLETVTRRWEDATDHEVASAIYRKYGFGVEADPTPRRSGAVGIVQQRCTDAALIRMLARRNGFEAFVAPAVAARPTPGASAGLGVVGRFRHAPVGREMLPPASLFPQTAPTLTDLTARCDAQRPAAIRGWHIDDRRMLVRATEVTDAGYQPGTVAATDRTRGQVVNDRLAVILGSNPPLVPVDIDTADAPHDDNELEAMARSRFRQEGWFATAEATIAASRYGRIVRAGSTLPVEGAGPIFGGSWYVLAAVHRWGATRQLDGDEPQHAIGPAAEHVDFDYEVDVELARTSLGGRP
ncbi:MAG: hypothetical protein ACK5RL_03960 [Acidimicrobiales bacterium]